MNLWELRGRGCIINCALMERDEKLFWLDNILIRLQWAGGRNWIPQNVVVAQSGGNAKLQEAITIRTCRGSVKWNISPRSLRASETFLDVSRETFSSWMSLNMKRHNWACWLPCRARWQCKYALDISTIFPFLRSEIKIYWFSFFVRFARKTMKSVTQREWFLETTKRCQINIQTTDCGILLVLPLAIPNSFSYLEDVQTFRAF